MNDSIALFYAHLGLKSKSVAVAIVNLGDIPGFFIGGLWALAIVGQQ